MQKMTKQTRAIVATKKALVRLWASLNHDDRKAFIACLDKKLVFHPKDDPRKATIAGGAV